MRIPAQLARAWAIGLDLLSRPWDTAWCGRLRWACVCTLALPITVCSYASWVAWPSLHFIMHCAGVTISASQGWRGSHGLTEVSQQPSASLVLRLRQLPPAALGLPLLRAPGGARLCKGACAHARLLSCSVSDSSRPHGQLPTRLLCPRDLSRQEY